MVEPAELAGADREAFNQALIRLAKDLGADSDPDRFSPSVILNEARMAMAADPEWKGFESFELLDPETHHAIKKFRSIRRPSLRTTFHGLGREVFGGETRSVVEWLSPYPSFGGLAIHSYLSYRELLEPGK